MSKSKTKKTRSKMLGPVAGIAIGGVLATAIATGILLVVSLLVLLGVLGRGMESWCVIAAAVIGVVAGGLYVTGRCERGRLLVCVGTGVVAPLVFLTMGLLCFGGVSGVGEMKAVFLACVVGGVLCGVLPALRVNGAHRKR